jgi:hypothetical protein
MRTRHLGVPGQRDLAAGQPSDRQPLPLRTERDDPLHVVAVAELDERGAGALRGDHGLELRGRAAMKTQRSRHDATLRHKVVANPLKGATA